MDLVEAGVLERFGVELIGADAGAIATAENRSLFKEAMVGIGLQVPSSGVAAPPPGLEKASKAAKVAGAMERASARWWPRSACPWSSGPPTSWAARAPASPPPPRSSRRWPATASTPARSPRS
ncbi:MAG: hypothetical protein R2746_11460 [Acidimicrobiales bacterium]